MLCSININNNNVKNVLFISLWHFCNLNQQNHTTGRTSTGEIKSQKLVICYRSQHNTLQNSNRINQHGPITPTSSKHTLFRAHETYAADFLSMWGGGRRIDRGGGTLMKHGGGRVRWVLGMIMFQFQSSSLCLNLVWWKSYEHFS